MDCYPSSPFLPTTSDPPAYDDWELDNYNTAVLPPSTHSDELEALQLLQEETTAFKTQRRQVIQHRSWKLEEVFLSDQDYPLVTPVQSRIIKNTAEIIQSSSPLKLAKMPSLLSSPAACPQTSSPPAAKRPLPAPAPTSRPKNLGAFVDGDSDDEEDDFRIDEPAAKRRMLDADKLLPNSLAEITEGDNREPVGASTGYQAHMDIFNAPVLNKDHEQSYSPIMPSFLRKSAGLKEGYTCSGKMLNIKQRQKTVAVPYEEMVAARSTTKAGRAKKSYYGIDIHQLVEDATKEIKQKKKEKPVAPEVPLPSVEPVYHTRTRRTPMWTEKYRARRFFDLVGDDRTHRDVLRWLKGWDPIVFPRSGKPKSVLSKKPGMDGEQEEKPHRKILLLTGPPGLGKTTLAHVCAMQAGYEIMEINASDDRSANVVKGRIRTSVGTESVKNVGAKPKDGHKPKPVRPVCVVVDEVDGVVGGSGGSGEGGFIRALIDLVQLDAKNAVPGATMAKPGRKKKEDDFFRLLRPMILICNDVYHPSLRQLRQSSFAEVIHIRKPPIDAVTARMKHVFEKEGVACEADGVRRLCEATWGLSSGPEAKFESSGTEGDLRSVLVVGEWVARKLKTDTSSRPKLTKKWVEANMASMLGYGGGGTRGVVCGGAKEIVSRVFLMGAGFPKPTMSANVSVGPKDANMPRERLHTAEVAKKAGMERIREMIDTSDESDRIMSDIFSTYPTQPFNDDSILSKPDAAHEWFHFYNACSKGVYQEQSWELMPYLSQPILACHNLFASSTRRPVQEYEKKRTDDDGAAEVEIPFTGPRADYEATEAKKLNRAMLVELQDSLRDEHHLFREQNATLLRSFRSPEDMATDLLPYLIRILSPDVKPVVVGGSGDSKGIASVRKEGEREMVKRAAEVMASIGVTYQRGKLEGDFGSRVTQWVYRMEPPLDTLVDYPTAGAESSLSAAPIRYAVRQVLDQEYQKAMKLMATAARQMRFKEGNLLGEDTTYTFKTGYGEKPMPVDTDENPLKVKKDFFGRVLSVRAGPLGETDGNAQRVPKEGENKVWVTYHEGFSNAVRKPITLEELLGGL
ncbi:hypothetical protein VE01_08038 [Pseudogymnoascus verrucosus]|uniref:AAA+ ATPase domain-containing protein n=1 Tax=Pseudogymnoascus verrucosus TaxID=342668 RepID=A0A1B8GCZ3_9PEZI|nr:uncharacterized protein VE01_08038 [Pseudogymnoascus verrucosus]OBT93704.1 hypothetical protein VE01_08038 [Pseudogymnoascus verrucosus]